MRIHKDHAFAAVAFAAPFFYLFRYVVAGTPFSRYIGNDFGYLYYNFKLYLLSALSQGDVPLWSPSEGCGFPFYSNPFAQILYPLNGPLFLYEKLTGGYSVLDHQRFTVLGISLFSVGLYLWLRSLDLPARHALFAAVVIGLSYKITELVRFPNAVHTVAWIPWILWGCTLAARRGGLRGGLIISASTLMMLTGGYLYYVYYSAFLFAPYAAALLIPAARRGLAGTAPQFDVKRFIGTLIVAFAAPLVICLPYLLKVSQLLAQTTDRGGQDFGYSTSHEFTFLDNVGSLVFPPAAQTEGWYYFGIAGLLLILFYGIRAFLERSDRQDLVLFCAVLTWIAVIAYITHGKHSLLFKVLWHYLPGFSSLRVWGRMNIILLPALALLLAKAGSCFERYLSGLARGRQAELKHAATLSLLSSSYLGILLTQIFLHRRSDLADPYWLAYVRPGLGADFNENVFIYSGAASFLLIAAALLCARAIDMRSRRILITLWASLAFVSLLDLGSVGPRQWSFPGPIGTEKNRLDVRYNNLRSLSASRIYDHSTVKFDSRFSAGYVLNWHYARFVDFLGRHGDSAIDDLDLEHKPADFKRLLALAGSQRLYFSASIDHATIGEFLSDADRHSAASGFHLVVVDYDGDYLKVLVETEQGGYLSFIDNWDPDWQAAVDGGEAEIEKLFGTFKSVALAGGQATVEMVYRPVG